MPLPLRRRPGGATAVPPLPREARLLLVGVAIDALGAGLALPFLVVYLHDVRGLQLATIGLVAAVPSAAALALLGPLGTMVDRIGPRRVQMAALSSQCLGMLLLAQAHSAPAAFVAQGLVGVGTAAFWPANHALIAAIVPEERRQNYFGLSFTLLNAGIGLGGLVGAAFADVQRPGTFVAIYVVDALSFLAPLLLLAWPLRSVGNAPQEHERDPGSYRQVLADRSFRPVLLLTFLTTLAGYGMLEAGWTAYARTVAGASTAVIGVAFAANTALIVLLQMVVVRRLDGRRRTRALAALGGLWAAAWLVLGLAGLVPGTATAAVLVVVSLAVFALGETLLSPVMPALTNVLAPERLRGRYNATSSLAFQVAAILAPAASGLLLQAGRGGLFVALLLLTCACIVLAAFRLERRLAPAANGVHPAQAALRPEPVPASPPLGG
jgi:MFS family permease